MPAFFPLRLLVVVLLALAPGLGRASHLSYPLLGHWDNREGTLEFWLTPRADLYPAHANLYVKVFDLFRVTGLDDFRLAGSWYRHGAQLGFKVSASTRLLRDGLLPVLPGDGVPPDLKPGEPMHIAFVWSQRHMQVWVNGRRAGVRGQSIPFAGQHGGGRLLVGGVDGQATPIVLHALRVSSVARYPKTVIPEPTADAATLLLDVFDRPLAADAASTHARVITAQAGETGARILGQNWHWVAAPRPGIAFYPAKPKSEEPPEK